MSEANEQLMADLRAAADLLLERGWHPRRLRRLDGWRNRGWGRRVWWRRSLTVIDAFRWVGEGDPRRVRAMIDAFGGVIDPPTDHTAGELAAALHRTAGNRAVPAWRDAFTSG